MSSRPKYDWKTIGAQVRESALEEVRLRGPYGYLQRVGRLHNIRHNALDMWLRHHPDWKAQYRAAVAAFAGEPSEADESPSLAPPAPPPPPAMDPGHPDLQRAYQTIHELREEGRLLRSELRVARKEESVFERAAALIREYTRPIPYVAHPREPVEAGLFDVDALVMLSDEHADQVITGAGTWGIERYNFDVFRCRLARWVEVIASYCSRHLPRYNFRRLWVAKLGDAINGPIHDAEYRNAFANSVRAALAVGDTEGQAIASLVPYFSEGVHVVCIPGNHPRLTKRKDYDDPHSNLDFLVATQLHMRLKEFVEAGKITVHVPRAYTAYVEICGHLCALNHGDDVIGTWGIPWYGFARKENRVQALVARHNARVRYFLYGHYHTPIERREGDSESLHAGAWMMTSPFAIEKVSGGTEPTQQLYVIDEPLGRIMSIPIFVRNPEREDQMRRGEWDPPFGSRTVLDEVGALDDVANLGKFPVIRAERADGDTA